MCESYDIDSSILREYDIRGIVDDNLKELDAYFIGLSFAEALTEKSGSTVCVGYDGRHSSPSLEKSLIQGLSSGGMDVQRIGLAPSPMLYFSVYNNNADAGIMITGSHNSPDYNGFKIMAKGYPFYGQAIKELGNRARRGCFSNGNGIISDKPVFNDYINRLLFDFLNLKELVVVWDPGNGSAGNVIFELVKSLPGHHYVINAEVDGNFPNHHPDPTKSENLEQIQDFIKRVGADVGFALDGDGDRLVVLDNQGNPLSGDKALLILSESVLFERPGTKIIADVKSSNLLFDEIKRLGGRAIMSETGHSIVKKNMIENGALLAGEMSGHIFFSDSYYGFDDAIYAALRFLSVLSSSSKTVTEFVQSFPSVCNTPEIRFFCEDYKKFKVIDDIKFRLESYNFKINDLDGLRVQSQDGWWLLRASNTEPALVARFEADSEDNIELMKKFLDNQLKLSGCSLPK